MYFNGYFNLDNWDDAAEYAVFDDFPDWKEFRNYKQWLGAQGEFTVTDKYRHKRSVKWGRPVIILSNEDPEWKEPGWVNKNTIYWKIQKGNKLF